jgi:hypothetical protein
VTLVVLGMVVALAACSNATKAATTTTKAPAATTTTKPGPKMTITPDAGLTNGQTVSITASGFPANEQLGITECANKGAQTGAGDCDLGTIKIATATATGTVSTSVAVALGPFGQNNIVCTNKPGCILSLAQAGSADPNAVATATLTFS